MKEDSELLKKYGRKIPFSTPKGYFENFTDDLMKQLPEKEAIEPSEISIWNRVKPWIYMAAMFCGIMFSIHILMEDRQTDYNSDGIGSISELPDEYIEPIVEQTMMDDYTLYQYLTDANISTY